MEKLAERLNRWKDEPVYDQGGKPKVARIVPSDIELFKLFTRYHHTTAPFAAEFLKCNAAALQRRMSLLARKPNSYLHRPLEQLKQYAQPNYRDQVFEIADRGVTELRKRGHWNDAERFGDRKLLAHSVMVNATIQSLELYAPKIIWREEIPKATNRIDVAISGLTFSGNFVSESHAYQNDSLGPFGIRYEDGSARFLQLEAELNGNVEVNNLEQTSFFKKFLSIQHIVRERLYQKMWGVPHLLSLIVCKDQHEIDRRKACIMRLTDGKGASYVLFREVPAMEDVDRPVKPDPELYTGPWQRAGYPDFHLNQP